MLADIGSSGTRVALRADLDALPVDDLTTDPWRSTVPGVAHACGHDVHIVGLLGAALALDEVHARGLLPGRVRLLFQPAEEVMPGGALHLIEAGALEGVSRIFGLHCDPSLDVGRVGLRVGPLTGAADALERPAHRQGRSHLPPAPDRGPDLRARQGPHRAARDPVPPARPPRRGRAWSGGGCMPAPRTT